MRNWTWKTWLVGVFALIPLVCAIAYIQLVPDDMETLRQNGASTPLMLALASAFGTTALALAGFGLHLFYLVLSDKASGLAAFGYFVAFVTGPILTIVAPGPRGIYLGWIVTLGAFPVYWAQFIKPEAWIPDI